MKIKPSVTQMQHITSKEFGERMDVVLDWIIAEDTAVIIEHHAKSYVLCPASWFLSNNSAYNDNGLVRTIRGIADVDDADIVTIMNRITKLLPEEFLDQISNLFNAILEVTGGSADKRLSDIDRLLDKVFPSTKKQDNGESA